MAKPHPSFQADGDNPAVIRIASGVILTISFLSLALLGPPLIFFIFIEVCVVVCLVELFGMMKAGCVACLRTPGIVCGVAVCASIYYGLAITVALILCVLAVTGVSIAVGGRDKAEMAANTLAGVMFVAVPLATLALIMRGTDGRHYLVLIVSANAFCDIFAYYIGRAFGKTALAPDISPGQTVEGFVGGLAGAVMGSVGAGFVLIPSLGLAHGIGVGLLAGLAGPLGDLSESAIKRRMGVKDSGRIIPGHGGALDRLDSLMFSSMTFYIYKLLFIT